MCMAMGPDARKILVVDDDQCMRELLRIHLSNAGYEVVLAEDAVMALKLLMRSPPSLLLVDVDMPFMDGLEFVGAVRSDPASSHIPVIFLTARTDVHQATAKLGAAACLTKPLLANGLFRAVNDILPAGRVPIG